MPEIIEENKKEFDWRKTASKGLFVVISGLLGVGVMSLTTLNPATGAITLAGLAVAAQNWWKNQGKELLQNWIEE